jgi:hypothetical protein
MLSRETEDRFAQEEGDDIEQNLTVSGHVHGNVFQIGKIVAAEQALATPSVIALRSFVDSLAVVPENVWEKVEVAEYTHLIGGYKESPPNYPEVVGESLAEIDRLCNESQVSLPKDWHREYWASGHIRVITKRMKDSAQSFLAKADLELLRMLEVLPRANNQTRLFLLHLFVKERLVESFRDTDSLELLIRRCQNVGLLSDGKPGGPPGSLNYYRSMRHSTTPLVGIMQRIIEMSGIKLQASEGEL